MEKQSILVRADWDPEAEVFVATSEDVPGLVAEAPTPKTLMAKLDALIPELLALNLPPHGHHASPAMKEIPVYVVHQLTSKALVPA